MDATPTTADVVAPSSPSDSFSCLDWSQQLLAAGAWDSTVRIWELQDSGAAAGLGLNLSCKAVFTADAPVLCCGFSQDGKWLASAGCGGSLRLWDVEAGQCSEMGRHEAAIKELAVVDEMGLVITGGWDKTLRFWKPNQASPAMSIPLPERVYAMDVKYPLLVVGTANRHVLTLNLPSVMQGGMPQPGCSQLKMQTRSISVFPDKDGYVIGGIDGRCGVCHFEASKSYTFKCHRSEDRIYSVNAMDFHPVHGSLSTVGSDGTINFWEKDGRHWLKHFDSCHCPITAAKFSRDGQFFAYAVSYDGSHGHQTWSSDLPRQVFVKRWEGWEKPRMSGFGG